MMKNKKKNTKNVQVEINYNWSILPDLNLTSSLTIFTRNESTVNLHCRKYKYAPFDTSP